MTKSEAVQKLKKFCDYRERCHSEVRTKLISLKVYGDQLEEVILELVQDNYLNEERYARSFVRGKHRINKWGRQRITRELKLKGVSQYCIKKGLSEIDTREYNEALQKIVEKYISFRQNRYPIQVLKKKTLQHAINKGYEYQLVIDSINDIM